MPLSIEHIIIRSLQKTSSAEEEKRLNAWLLEDDKHIELFCQLQEIWNSGRQMSEEEIAGWWQELSAKTTKPKSNIFHTYLNDFTRSWKSYSAAVVIGIILSMSAWFMFRPEPATMTEIVNNLIVYNESGVRKIILPDSSVVWLNPNSSIRYPEHFAPDKRRVVLEGNAFFEITKNTQQPFIVNIDHVDIQVTGTEFFVESGTDHELASITLISGGVSVNLLNKEKQVIRSSNLVPEEQVTVNKTSGEQIVTKVDIRPYVAWKSGEYVFEDEILDNIIQQLDFRFEKDIQIQPALKNKRFTGKININHKLEDVLEIMNYSYPIQYTIKANKIYIYEK